MPELSKVAGFWNTSPTHHTKAEDFQGLMTGAVISSLGFFLLGKAGLLTGGTAGVAFLMHYLTNWSFGLWFFLLNLPFYYLSIRKVGWDFTLKTFVAIGATSALVEVQPHFLGIATLNPIWAAILGGLLLGYGLLAFYRHRASLGGVGILGIYLQDRFGIRAGLVQMAFDVAVLIAAFFVVDPYIVACSVLSAVVINLFVTVNHRKDRYIVLR